MRISIKDYRRRKNQRILLVRLPCSTPRQFGIRIPFVALQWLDQVQSRFAQAWDEAW